MSKSNSRLASGLAVAVMAAGLAAAQGIPGVAQPAAPTAGTPVQVTVEVVTNAAKGYQIGYPTGWSVVAGSDNVDYAFLSPDENAICIAYSFPQPDLASVPEETLRQAMSKPQGEEFWTQDFFSQIQNVKYLHTGAVTNHPSGWPLQTVIATGDIEIGGSPLNVTFAGIWTVKSATIYRVMCYTPSQLYDANKAQFFAVFDSFKITK
jgi:hypothetical protein